MSRGGFKVNKNSYEYARSERVNWLDTFADEYDKATSSSKDRSAVDVARERNQQSVYEQVSALVGQHATVESKVQDMQERTGLTTYLKSMASAEEVEVCSDTFSKFGPKMQEDLMSFCRNKIAAHRGQCTVSQLQYDLLSTFRQHGIQPHDVHNEDVARCISGLIVDELRINPPTETVGPELGKVDPTEDDEEDGPDFFSAFQNN